MSQSLHRSVGECERVSGLAPRQLTGPIAPEQKSRVLGLLMYAHTGEAELLDQFDLTTKSSA